MDINFDKDLVKVIKTGDVIFGSKKSIKIANSGKAKLLILANNCPKEILKYISKEVKTYTHESTSKELGHICGKPFTIASMAILNEGDSKLLSLLSDKNKKE